MSYYDFNAARFGYATTRVIPAKPIRSEYAAHRAMRTTYNNAPTTARFMVRTVCGNRF